MACGYLLGVTDDLAPFQRSSDPLLPTLTEMLAGVRMGDAQSAREAVKPMLGNAALFGVSLVDAGLADRVAQLFADMVAGPGAVRSTLEKTLWATKEAS